MADLLIQDVPNALHRRLRRYAKKNHRAISDIALSAIEREIARLEWHEKLSQRPAMDVGVSAACANLQKDAEQAMAEESLAGEADWPEY